MAKTSFIHDEVVQDNY